ncbi:hypothetical protein COY91_03210 [Candidatus Shapirobacteria bacterium CG_4_10_14_0_8_um_filter_39_15]|nr:MAG: hypothetical protein COY91_03210 [Candidatus Shapirobacteria bacterium CG_4_10_14_0_8_um_filter_39_15]PJE68059.1 MAG: hypothetical protein COU94_03840 [Candidatus Shapirobacteria bacterium CG10_big_fil_rev_8_21_14_0_10_38_8]
MSKHLDDFEEKPAVKEYFIRFCKIQAEKEGIVKNLVLTSTPNPDDENSKIIELCDKVQIGETLEQAIKRSLKTELEIDQVKKFFVLEIEEKAKNNKGKFLPRSVLYVEVEYQELTVSKFQDFFVN